jgi:hypothetical protein
MAVEDWIPDFDPFDDRCEDGAGWCRDCEEPIAWIRSANPARWIPIDRDGERHRCHTKIAAASEFPKLEDKP